MRNIAKCKLCKDIIESFHASDHVFCKCGEISVNEGAAMRCTAKDFNNFLRVDDKGNEIIVTFVAKDKETEKEKDYITKNDLLKQLDEQILSIESLSDTAKLSNLNHYDILSLMFWLSAFFKSKD